ncbi:aminotransferase class III-fold pyridoxal phosphate-dependent enzyme [Haliangium sp. UPWRP_2]|uniref:aminotransferase class III-fold pyridoxal phosphate-dependent enzyme n=1 Tax=Haliangium sp. UPWRP_2 TaxID=1931276 RepID=UPI000D0E13C4|nr:aminotransferase class III-fold pyridoxal phosphate-dependent enzyme [Haliangium sp. UPWRP_2]PSM31534.1 aspartate aminotransferase family protein [Haliangium sp. UPWRP_2]HNN92259.1 aminotransferase class III-fold pyridoxal phosphate-dependent enzyme [Pseudomonadota bacterium]
MTKDSLTADQARYLADFTERYVARTRGSQQRREETWPALADARSSQGLFAGTPPRAKAAWLVQKALRYPIVAARADGAQVWDIDGNVYTDYCLGFGVHLFGHRPHFLQAALTEQLERGLPIGFQSDRANQVARAIVAMTGMERVAFCNTGAEAVMGALRLARAVMGRDRIVCFAHAYHGSYDGTLPAIDMPSGVPASLRRDVQVLEYGSPASLQAIADGADGIAAVLVEPVQARSPSLQPVEFLRALRTLTRDRGIALVFDEVLLGFRIHQGGCQAHFGVCADLATYGKILGGGLPIGVIAGSARFLDRIDGGRWHHAGDSRPSSDKVWFAGTFTKNPLTMAAAAAVTTELLDRGPTLQASLNARTADLCQRANAWLTTERFPVKLEPFGSLFRLAIPPELWLLLPHLRLHGIYAFDGLTFFLSTEHTDDALDHLLSALQESLLGLRAGGYLPLAA